eukprot:jgi/Galph1/1902/GphlegSOOS_G583.1
MIWMILIGRAITGLGMRGEYACNFANALEDSEEANLKRQGRRTSLLVLYTDVLGNYIPLVIQLILVAAACRHVYLKNSGEYLLPNCHPQPVIMLPGQAGFGGVILQTIIEVSLFKGIWIGLAESVVIQTRPLIASFAVNKLGRQSTQVLGWCWLGCTQLITAGTYLLLKEHPVAYVIWTTFVFIFQYFVFVPVYLVPADIYLTRVRALMFSLTSIVGKVGGILGITVFPRIWKGLGEERRILRD